MITAYERLVEAVSGTYPVTLANGDHAKIGITGGLSHKIVAKVIRAIFSERDIRSRLLREVTGGALKLTCDSCFAVDCPQRGNLQCTDGKCIIRDP